MIRRFSPENFYSPREATVEDPDLLALTGVIVTRADNDPKVRDIYVFDYFGKARRYVPKIVNRDLMEWAQQIEDKVGEEDFLDNRHEAVARLTIWNEFASDENISKWPIYDIEPVGTQVDLQAQGFGYKGFTYVTDWDVDTFISQEEVNGLVLEAYFFEEVVNGGKRRVGFVRNAKLGLDELDLCVAAVVLKGEKNPQEVLNLVRGLKELNFVREILNKYQSQNFLDVAPVVFVELLRAIDELKVYNESGVVV